MKKEEIIKILEEKINSILSHKIPIITLGIIVKAFHKLDTYIVQHEITSDLELNIVKDEYVFDKAFAFMLNKWNTEATSMIETSLIDQSEEVLLEVLRLLNNYNL
jgi:hypothetical protein